MTKTEQIINILKDDMTTDTGTVAHRVGCTRRLVRKVRAEMTEGEKRLPKILLFDIETSLMEIYTWGLYKQKPGISQIVKDWSILSWSAKWLCDSTMFAQHVTAEEAAAREDKSILKGLWKLLDEADLVIGHNIQKFDVRKVNLRFALAGMYPPSPYRCIDTFKHALKLFNSASYKMDYLNKIFGLQMKDDAPYAWWTGAAQGDSECIEKMAKYNQTDVLINEELYLKLRPWIKGHPNLALYMDTEEMVCTNCGSESLGENGYYYTPAGRFLAFRCNDCGAVGRSRYSDISKEERARLLLSIAS